MQPPGGLHATASPGLDFLWRGVSIGQARLAREPAWRHHCDAQVLTEVMNAPERELIIHAFHHVQ
eukprot:1160878-Pelagomonas_calceolata.AAC.1